MAETSKWDQSVFNATLKDYLMAHESSVWPKAINKRAFFVAHAALRETPETPSLKIFNQLSRTITAKRQDGSTGNVQLGYVLAAKRASKTWTSSARYNKIAANRAAGGRASANKAWQAEVSAKFGKIWGGRAAATAFIRLGYRNIKQTLAPLTGLSAGGDGVSVAKLRGRFKGSVSPATASNLQVTIENMAHSRTEHRGAFERIGYPSLDRAMQKENASMRDHLEKEMAPGIQAFNARQH